MSSARYANAAGTDIALEIEGSFFAVKPGDPRLSGVAIQPYELPSPPPMPAITAAQLRLALLGMGMTSAQVEAAISAMPGTEMQREAARIQWEYATTFPRQHLLVVAIGAALDLTEAQIDAAWLHAATL